MSGEGLWPSHPQRGSDLPPLPPISVQATPSSPLPALPCPGPGSPEAPLQPHRLSRLLGTPPAGAPISCHRPRGEGDGLLPSTASAETCQVPYERAVSVALPRGSGGRDHLGFSRRRKGPRWAGSLGSPLRLGMGRVLVLRRRVPPPLRVLVGAT